MIKYLKDKYKDQDFKNFLASGANVDFVNKDGRVCKRTVLPDGKVKFYCGLAKMVGNTEIRCDSRPGPSCPACSDSTSFQVSYERFLNTLDPVFPL